MDWGIAAITFVVLLAIGIPIGIKIWGVGYVGYEDSDPATTAAIQEAKADYECKSAALSQAELGGVTDPFELSALSIPAIEASIKVLKLTNAASDAAEARRANRHSAADPIPAKRADHESPSHKSLAVTASPKPPAASIVVADPVQRTAKRAVQESWVYDLRSRYQFNKSMGRTVAVLTLLAGVVIVPFQIWIGFLFVVVGGLFAKVAFTRTTKWSLRWFCPGCGKRHHASLPWRCGHCDHVTNDISFLEVCGNPNCRATPKAFECPFCDLILFLDSDNDGRHAARKDTAPPMPVHRRDEDLRVSRQNELDELEHMKRKLEYDIKFAEMNRTLNPPTPVKTDPRQERMNRMFNAIEDAVIDCTTLQQTMVKEKRLHADIDANPDLDDSQKAEMKKMVTLKFDDLRYELSRNVRV